VRLEGQRRSLNYELRAKFRAPRGPPALEYSPMPSFSVVTFGCQMNAHDSSRMEEVLRGAGYHGVDSPEDADVVLLNTCSIREKAEQKLRSEVGRLGLLKKKRPDLVIGVAGCVAQQEGERLLKGLPQIDLIIGPDNIPELPALLAQVETGGLPQVRTVFDVEEPSFLAAAPVAGQAGASAFVTVMKGCNERCSYCIVPYTRGPERYRASAEIIAEVQRFVAAGVREITLLGQTVNSYNDPSRALNPAPGAGSCRWKHTRGAIAAQDETEFPALLRAIAQQVPGLLRLRYTSPHPRHLTSSLILAHQDLPVLARHVHMPVQSGSDALLKRMIRRYSAAEYVERTDALKAAVPGLTLTTDMIVGFPGESESDFEDSLEIVRRVGFTALYGFTYSQRPFTPALKLEDDVSSEEKSRRLQRLFELVDAQKLAHLQSLVGTRQEVLVDGLSKAGNQCGRTEQNEIVHLNDITVEGIGTGSFVEVTITDAFRNSVAAKIERVIHSAPFVKPKIVQPPSNDGRRQLTVLA
jgi:tRNA-2-methylthio-N6-dimethylallyladenosine synthase